MAMTEAEFRKQWQGVMAAINSAVARADRSDHAALEALRQAVDFLAGYVAGLYGERDRPRAG